MHDFLHGTLRKCKGCIVLGRKAKNEGFEFTKKTDIPSIVTTHCAPQNKQTAEKLRRRSFLCLGLLRVSQSLAVKWSVCFAGQRALWRECVVVFLTFLKIAVF